MKNARSLVVASNWNTILTLKPKIGEYSLAPPARFSPAGLLSAKVPWRNKATTTEEAPPRPSGR